MEEPGAVLSYRTETADEMAVVVVVVLRRMVELDGIVYRTVAVTVVA